MVMIHKIETLDHVMAEQMMRRSEDWSRTYVSSKVPLTKELVSEVLPTARNPKTATFL